MTARKFNVDGIAVKTGLSKNNHLFLGEELEKSAPTLMNRPILKDHVGTVDSAVGKVTKTSIMKEGEDTKILFSGFVLDDGVLADKIENGIISEVSIGAYAEKMLKENEDSDVLIPVGLHMMEISLTPVPAVDGTQIAKTSVQEKKVVEMIKCPECDKEFESKEEMTAHMETAHEKESKKEETKMSNEKIDYATELAKVQEELAKFKLEQARKELEAAKIQAMKTEIKAEPKTVSAATAENTNLLDGYIVEKLENGKMGISKKRPACTLF